MDVFGVAIPATETSASPFRLSGTRMSLSRAEPLTDQCPVADSTRQVAAQSNPRESPAKAITRRFFPIDSSSKSTVTFASFPLPVTSEMVPEPNFA